MSRAGHCPEYAGPPHGRFKLIHSASTQSTSTPAAPIASSSRAPFGQHVESVNLLAIPEDVKDARLVQELRAMVVGETILNEAQKA